MEEANKGANSGPGENTNTSVDIERVIQREEGQ